MGCDIHIYVEHKVNGVWVEAPHSAAPIDTFYTNFLAKKPEAEKTERDEYFNRPTWSPGRSYVLFGALAGVRGSMLESIVEPRGIPEDVSGSIGVRYEEDGYDAHTASYYTVDELLVARDITCPVSAYFEVKDYAKYKEDNDPENWYNTNAPRGYTEISNAEMDRLIEQVAFWGDEKYITKVNWDMPYRNSSKGFWITIVDAMAALDPDPKNVRMVFWFDN